MRQSYEEKKWVLKAVGWMEASGGEWFPPPFIEVPTTTTSFEVAFDLTKSLALSERDAKRALTTDEVKAIVNTYFDGGSNG
jgi:hypothetical protein